MCDLNGDFSGDLLEGEAGIDLIQKLIVGAFSSPNFTLETKSDYKELLSTTFSVKARLGEGEKLSLVLKKP